ncbi:MAG: hypothetical protein SNJ82_01785 [Gemmataceae bacterium]
MFAFLEGSANCKKCPKISLTIDSHLLYGGILFVSLKGFCWAGGPSLGPQTLLFLSQGVLLGSLQKELLPVGSLELKGGLELKWL